jgi:hypothetical protein
MAARWAGYKPRDFFEKESPEWQAKVIAHYIIDSKITAVTQQDGEQKGRGRSNKKPAPGGNSPPYRSDNMQG